MRTVLEGIYGGAIMIVMPLSLLALVVAVPVCFLSFAGLWVMGVIYGSPVRLEDGIHQALSGGEWVKIAPGVYRALVYLERTMFISLGVAVVAIAIGVLHRFIFERWVERPARNVIRIPRSAVEGSSQQPPRQSIN
jgi:ABC-type phosphate transport system permease subunit